MKKLFTFLLITLLANGLNYSAAQGYQWAKNMGGTGATSEGNSITYDASGNVYSAGVFTGTVDFDPGSGIFNLTSSGGNDIYIQKLGASGNFLWAKSMGGIHDDFASTIKIDNTGNVFVAGYFQDTVDFDPGTLVHNIISAGANDIFILKLDASGNFVFVKTIGGVSNDLCNSLFIDNSGNIYATGYFKGTVDFDPGVGFYSVTSLSLYNDLFILKMDDSANFLWTKTLSSTFSISANSIAVDLSGNIYTTGNCGDTTDFDPGLNTYYLIGGGTFVLKLDSMGNFLWATETVGNFQGYTNCIAVDLFGNVYITGSLELSILAPFYDIFITKYSPSGNIIWQKIMDGGIYASLEEGRSIAVDANGGVYLTGSYVATVDFDPGVGTYFLSTGFQVYSNIFIQKLDSSGNLLWVKGFTEISGLVSYNSGYSISVDMSGNIYTTGYFEGMTDFDPGSPTDNLTAVGNRNAFVLKLNSCLDNSSVDLVTACDSYTWIDGNTYSSSNNTAKDTLVNVSGCDSIITLNLTILNSSSRADTITACNSYTWIDGITYTASNNTATDTLINVAGCDSIITLNLTILNSSTGTDVVTACNSYTWVDGITYTTSNNIANDTLLNAAGCDSVITLNLTINSVSDITTMVNDVTITSNNAGNTAYQWLNCDSNFAIIAGENSQFFTALSNGNYAVELTENGCKDTSACAPVTTVGTFDKNMGEAIIVSPNPNDGSFSLEIPNTLSATDLKIYNTLGEVVYQKNITSQRTSVNTSLNYGLYFLQLKTGKGILKRKVAIEH